MKKSLIVLTLLSCSNVFAQDYSFSVENYGNVSVRVSATEPNVIQVKNDVITSITSKDGAISQDNNTSTGGVIFSTIEDKKFSIIVETEKGASFTINAVPSKKQSSATILINGIIPNKSVTVSHSSSNSSYGNQIVKLMQAFMNDRVPDSFEEASVSWKDISLNPYFSISVNKAWQSDGIKVIRLLANNITNSSLELNERYFWQKNVIAIAYYPNLIDLPPRKSVYVYIFLQDKEND